MFASLPTVFESCHAFRTTHYELRITHYALRIRNPMTDLPPPEDRRSEYTEEPPPGFRSWRSVYALVLGLFVLMVALLYAFTLAFA
jgi:hypothetical protein